MGTVNLDGNLIAGPVTTADFPAGISTFAVATSPNPKTYAAKVSGQKALASPGSYVTLGGIGTSQDVTACDFLYLKTDAAISVRITQTGVGSPAVLMVQGTLILEFPEANACNLVEIEGTANIEYLATGQA